LVGHAVSTVSIRQLRRQLGIEQHYDEQGKSTWALPERLWPEVTDNDRATAQALLEAARAQGPARFVELWDEHAAIRGWQVAMALAELAIADRELAVSV
jgi:hypothetical protein